MSCKCCCTHGHTAIQEKRNSLLKDYWRIILSALLLFGGLILNATDTTFFKGEYVPFIWYLLAYLPVGLPVMREAWESILQKDVFSEFTLMSIATLGAFYIGESVGELFQDKAVDKAKRNISALLDVRPETATVIRNGSTLVEAPQRVQVGETIEVKAGERVPLDGTMLDEVAAFNTSALTGESVPRNIRQGGEVLAGMIATDKVVRIQVTKPFEKSALSRILELVQNASERKAPAELFIRKFARIYTPTVTGLAALIVLLPFLYSLADAQFSFIFNDWLYRALVFLVIFCPCALVVSIPLGYFGGIGPLQRGQLPRCHQPSQHGGSREDGYADQRHLRCTILPGTTGSYGREVDTACRLGRAKQYAPHSQSHHKLCQTKRYRADCHNGRYGDCRPRTASHYGWNACPGGEHPPAD